MEDVNDDILSEDESLQDKMPAAVAGSDDESSDDQPIRFQRRRRWGRYPPSKTAACDQHPMNVNRGDRTWEFIGSRDVFIRNPKRIWTNVSSRYT